MAMSYKMFGGNDDLGDLMVDHVIWIASWIVIILVTWIVVWLVAVCCLGCDRVKQIADKVDDV